MTIKITETITEEIELKDYFTFIFDSLLYEVTEVNTGRKLYKIYEELFPPLEYQLQIEYNNFISILKKFNEGNIIYRYDEDLEESHSTDIHLLLADYASYLLPRIVKDISSHPKYEKISITYK